MKSEEELLLCLVRAGLHPGEECDLLAAFADLDAQSWARLYRLCVDQGVAAVAWDGMSDALRQCLPLPLRIRWALAVEQIGQRYDHQRRVLGRLAAFYSAHNIPVMGLKGYAASLCYPIPSHRPCGDIDIWLFGRQAEADALLLREKGIRVDNGEHHHTKFIADGVVVENHYDFINIHARASNRLVERRLQQLALLPGQNVMIDGSPLHLPPPDFNALFLLRHAAMHFAAAEIGLRHLTDWALFVGHYRGRIDWEALTDLARELNMHRFLDAINAISIDFLGVAPELLPSVHRDEALQRRVLHEILAPGFSEIKPRGNILKVVGFKARRWWANRWKHRLVYSDGLVSSFLHSAWSHLLKPRTIRR